MRFNAWLAGAALLLCGQLGYAGVTCGAGGGCTQTIELEPGWNAIYVKVDPDDTASSSIFADLLDREGPRIASAWTWLAHRARVDFILDPETEDLLSEPGWLRYFPPDSDESFLTNLFAITANRAYLVRLEGSEPASLVISGQPVPPRTRWIPDALNLTGFHVDEASPPTFLDFFAPSPAHDGSPIYRLDNASGAWVAVNPASELVQPDAAYWIFSQGGSDYTGPVALERGRRLDFGPDVETLGLSLENSQDSELQVSLGMVANGEPVFYRNPDPASDTPWLPLAGFGAVPAPGGAELRITLGLRRGDLVTSSYNEVLEVLVPGFSRYLIPMTATAPALGASRLEPYPSLDGLAPRASREESTSLLRRLLDWLAPPALAQADYSGLWVGVVEIDRVSQANHYQHDCVPDPDIALTVPNPDDLFQPVYVGIDPGTGTDLCTDADGRPTLLDTATLAPVEPTFQFRIILHQDSGGTVHLLKDVIQMWENGEAAPDGTVITPGRYVLLTDDGLVPFYEGTQLRDGETVGARVSTAAYDYDAELQTMSGSLGTSLSTVMTLSATAPTNPFRHLYHNQHQEGFAITRAMSLVFDGDTGGTLGDGYSRLAGSFEETVTGLHQYPVISAGTFSLKRLSEVTQLTTEVGG